MTAAEAIRTAMTAHGLNQKLAAARLEISEQYLSDILNKRLGISAFMAIRLQVTLGIDGRKLMIDQALVEYERARLEYAKKVQP